MNSLNPQLIPKIGRAFFDSEKKNPKQLLFLRIYIFAEFFCIHIKKAEIYESEAWLNIY